MRAPSRNARKLCRQGLRRQPELYTVSNQGTVSNHGSHLYAGYDLPRARCGGVGAPHTQTLRWV